jgi:hypothetical protein
MLPYELGILIFLSLTPPPIIFEDDFLDANPNIY